MPSASPKSHTSIALGMGFERYRLGRTPGIWHSQTLGDHGRHLYRSSGNGAQVGEPKPRSTPWCDGGSCSRDPLARSSSGAFGRLVIGPGASPWFDGVAPVSLEQYLVELFNEKS